jgi:hypothetical protein
MWRSGHTDLKGRIQAMDKARIDVAAIFMSPWLIG